MPDRGAPEPVHPIERYHPSTITAESAATTKWRDEPKMANPAMCPGSGARRRGHPPRRRPEESRCAPAAVWQSLYTGRLSYWFTDWQRQGVNE
jgi:hypothetical protein